MDQVKVTTSKLLTQTDNNTISKKCYVMNEETGELSKENFQLKNKLRINKLELRKCQNDLKHLEAEANEATVEIDKLITSQKQYQQDTSSKLENLKDETGRLSEENKQLKMKYQSKELELEKCQNFINEVKASFENHIAIQQQYEHDTSSEIQNLKGEKFALNQMVSGYTKQFEEMEIRLSTLAKENSSLKIQLSNSEQVARMHEQYKNRTEANVSKETVGRQNKRKSHSIYASNRDLSAVAKYFYNRKY